MTTQEFERWRKHHAALFPGLLAYLKRAFGSDQEQFELFWKEWFRALQKLNLNDAIAASRKLAEEADEHLTYDRHPQAIVKLAKEARITRWEHEWPPQNPDDCELCYGSGAVLVRIQTPSGTTYSAATRCTCPAGSRYRFLRQFDPERDTLDR